MSSVPPTYSACSSSSNSWGAATESDCSLCLLADCGPQYTCASCHTHLCFQCYGNHVSQCLPPFDLGRENELGYECHNEKRRQDGTSTQRGLGAMSAQEPFASFDFYYTNGNSFASDFLSRLMPLLPRASEKDDVAAAKCQVSVLLEVILGLRLQEESLKRQNMNTKRNIKKCFAEAVAQATRDRDSSLQQLEDITKALSSQLQMEQQIACNAHSRLAAPLMSRDKTSWTKPSYIHRVELQAAMLSQAALQHFQQLAEKLKTISDTLNVFVDRPSEEGEWPEEPCLIDQSQLHRLHTELDTLRTENQALCSDDSTLHGVMAELRADIQTLCSAHQTLQTEVEELRAENRNLHTENRTLQMKMEELRAEIKALCSDNNGLQTEQAVEAVQIETERQTRCGDTDEHQMEAEIETWGLPANDKLVEPSAAGSNTDQLNRLQEQVQALCGKMEALTTQLTVLKSSQHTVEHLKTRVAFHTFLEKPAVVKSPRVLVCSDVLTNIGGGYSNATGYFTAPVTGLYLFMAHACAGSIGRSTDVGLYLEGEDIAYIQCVDLETQSCHAIVKVKAREKVYLQVDAGRGKEAMHLTEFKTSFSGMLVQRDI